MKDPVKSILGSLHDPEVIRLYKTLGATPEVIDILTFGVPITWTKDADFKQMSASNNKSALRNHQFVSETLTEWIKIGALVPVPRSKAKIVSPISVSTKWDHARRAIKKRVCFDGSRMKEAMCYHPVKLPDVRFLSSYCEPHDEIATVDMTK